MLVNYKEIFKLKVMLDNANIPCKFFDRSYIISNVKYPSYQIIVYKQDSKDRLISVIEGFGTCGEQDDLLEIMGCLTDKEQQEDNVLGFLTANEVFERIKKHFK